MLAVHFFADALSLFCIHSHLKSGTCHKSAWNTFTWQLQTGNRCHWRVTEVLFGYNQYNSSFSNALVALTDHLQLLIFKRNDSSEYMHLLSHKYTDLRSYWEFAILANKSATFKKTRVYRDLHSDTTYCVAQHFISLCLYFHYLK